MSTSGSIFVSANVMITSNLVFSQWDQPDLQEPDDDDGRHCLVHHATILEFDGESVCAQKAKERACS